MASDLPSGDVHDLWNSIEVTGYAHRALSIPVAARVGLLIMTGGVHGTDPAARKLADKAEEQPVWFSSISGESSVRRTRGWIESSK